MTGLRLTRRGELALCIVGGLVGFAFGFVSVPLDIWWTS